MNCNIVSTEYEKNRVIRFLNKFFLRYDKNIDFTLYLEDNDEIIATGSKAKNVIKCFAVDDKYKNQGLSNVILTQLRNKIFELGYKNSFVFTKPENYNIFTSLGYVEVAKTDSVLLLEDGSNIDTEIDNMIKNYNINTKENHSMIVMNANPFTLGHRYLVECALKSCQKLLVFVLEEDISFFSYKDRLKMVKLGLEDLKNVIVIPSTKYIISLSTFPTYFLKEKDSYVDEFIDLDSEIIINKFCKKLNINKRYLGTEPVDKLTLEYNKIISEKFPQNKINVSIIDRLETKDGKVISASFVRKKYQEADFDSIVDYVPKTTLNYLKELKNE